MGFEVVGSRVVDTNAHGKSLPSKGKRENRRYHASAPVDEGGGKLNLKPKLHSSVPVDMDEVSEEDFSCESKTTYNPKKYRDAEEAKQTRRMRRGEC